MLSTVSFPCTVVTPFRAFHADLPGYHTFLSLHPSATFTIHDSVQLSGFDLLGSLTLMHSLMRFLFVRPEICPWVSMFPISSFLQIPPHDGHPCFWLYPSHCQADSGLAPVRNVRRQAHQEKKKVSR